MKLLSVLKSVAFSLALVIVSIATLWILDPVYENFVEKHIDVLSASNYQVIDRYDNKHVPVPSDITLSIVIPAYNEEKRMHIMLDETISFLQSWSNNDLKYEIIVVDDGSKDKTANIATQYFEKNSEVFRFVRLLKNQGKGAAVKLGVAKAIGKYILFADADGATDFRDISKLLKEIKKIEKYDRTFDEKMGIVAGSRAHLEKDSVASREWYRTILMKGFHFYVQALVTFNVKDTQCGFKLFTSKTAKLLFSNLHLYRWAFDIELVYLAERLNVPITEVAVNWHEVEGSKLIKNKSDVVITSLTMARDILCLRLAYLFGLWRLDINSDDGQLINKNSEL